jgi:hypothetical protein
VHLGDHYGDIRNEHYHFKKEDPRLSNGWDRVGKRSMGVDREFTGRQLQLDTLRNGLFEPPRSSAPANGQSSVAVIHGIGGSGKTRFCMKYYEENRDRCV